MSDLSDFSKLLLEDSQNSLSGYSESEHLSILPPVRAGTNSLEAAIFNRRSSVIEQEATITRSMQMSTVFGDYASDDDDDGHGMPGGAKQGNGKSIFSMFKAFVGLFVLALPDAVAHAGYIGALVTLVILAYISYINMIYMIRCAEIVTYIKLQNLTSRRKPGVLSVSLGEIGRHAGGPALEKVVTATVLICQMAFGICYFIFIGSNLSWSYSVFYWPHAPNRLPDTWALGGDGFCILICAAVLMPVVYKASDLSRFQLSTMFATFITIAGLGLLIGYAGYVVYQDGVFIDTVDEGINSVAAFRWKSFPLFFGLAVGAFEGMGLVLPVRNAMKTPEDMPFVVRVTLVVVLLLFCTIGAIGYLAFEPDLAETITLNMPRNTFGVSIVLLYTFAILLSYPIQMFPVFKIAERYCKEQRINIHYPTMRVFIMLFTMLVGMYIPYFSLFANLVGAVACSALLFVLPSIFWIRLCHVPLETEVSFWKHLLLPRFFIVLGVVGGIVSVYATIVAFIEE